MTRTKTRALANWPNNGVSVLDYGAVGDGSVDDTQAFKDAIAVVSVQNGPKRLFVPHGTYRITSTLTVAGNGVNIEGEGIGSPLIQAGAPCSRLILDFNGVGVEVTGERFVLKDIELYGSDSRWGASGSKDGTKAGIRIGNSIGSRLERVNVYREPGIGIYTYGNNVSSVYSQVTVERCKSIGYLFSKGQGSAFDECGIITMDTCRAVRCHGEAVMAGNPNDTSLSAYRILQLNCEYVFCGGMDAQDGLPTADHVVRIYGDNCTMIGCAISSPQNQPGGTSTTKGQFQDGSTADNLVKGVYVEGRNSLLLNNRYIRPYEFGVTIGATSTYCKVDGAELRTDGADFNYAVDIQQGASGFQIERVGRSQCSAPSNISTAVINASDTVVKSEGTTLKYSVNGDGFVVEPAYVALTTNNENALRVDAVSKETRIYGDLRINTTDKVLKMVAPNGNVWSIAVTNTGDLYTFQ